MQKRYCYLSLIAASGFRLILAVMIIDGQIIVILNYPLTLLKPIVDIQCL